MKKYLFSLLTIFCGLLGLVSCSEDTDENLEQYYTVTFNSMGGSEIEDQKVKSGELAVKPGNPSKEGEIFISWFTSDKYDREWNFSEDVVNENVTLFAKWAKQDEVCIVTFETNNENKIESVNVEKGGKLSVLPEPTRDGFVFEGWYMDSDFKTKFELSTAINSNITLYAKWKAESEDSLKKMLNELIDKAESIKAEDYTETSYKFMQESLKVAKDVIANAEATKDELQKAYDNLKMAVDNLFLDLLDKPYRIDIDDDETLWQDKYLCINSEWNSDLSVTFMVLDKSGYYCKYDYDLDFKYDKEKLKNWTKDGIVKETNDGISMNLKSNLTIDEEIEITASLKENPSISKTITLKVFSDEWIKNKLIETVNSLPDVSEMTLDNYMELKKIYNNAASFNWAGILPSNYNDPDIQEVAKKLNIYGDAYGELWWDDPFIEVENGVYPLNYTLCKYTSNGNKFPIGTFESEPVSIDNNWYYQYKYEFSDKEYKILYREFKGSISGEWEPELRCEYKIVEENGNSTLITHVVEDYYEPESRSVSIFSKRMHKK